MRGKAVWPSRSEAGPPGASCLPHRLILRKQPRRWVRLQNRHAHTMCRNDQSGIVAMAATLCGSEAAKLTAAMPPAAPALAEVAAAVASFSRCPRFFATSLSCSALAFREAGGSRPRQSEPSSFVLPAWSSASTEMLSAGRIPNRLATILRVTTIMTSVHSSRESARSATVRMLSTLPSRQPCSKCFASHSRAAVASWCPVRAGVCFIGQLWSAQGAVRRVQRAQGVGSFSVESRVRYGARSASLDAKR